MPRVRWFILPGKAPNKELIPRFERDGTLDALAIEFPRVRGVSFQHQVLVVCQCRVYQFRRSVNRQDFRLIKRLPKLLASFATSKLYVDSPLASATCVAGWLDSHHSATGANPRRIVFSVMLTGSTN